MSERNLGSAVLEPDEIGAEQIRTYLKSHPAFFLENADLLEDLKVPHRPGNAISLVERQAEVMRKRIRDQESQLARLIANARENEKLFAKTRTLILALLEAQSLDDIGAAIEDGFREQFGTDACSLILVREEFGDSSGNVRTATRAEIAEHAPQLSGIEQACGGAFPEAAMAFLFQLHDQPMQSAMVAPVGTGTASNRIGILALGSLDRAHFSESLGTEFLDYVSEVLARALRPYRN